ncbi:serine/threonine-protein kinase [Calditrichota bacterium LG25]
MAIFKEGQKIRGTYEVERFLGEGAFAEVYRVKHRFLGRQAMKVFKLVGIKIDEIEDMLSEALLLSRIGHPNIVRVFDANVAETSQGMYGYFTMEYVAGGSLERFWQSHEDRFVPVQTSIEIIKQVCSGLAIAHNEKPPIIHRDIKPQNILIGYDTNGIRVRLSDFGLAKRVNPLTLFASAKGTRCFKAPEVFKDHLQDSCAGDVWALGCTLYLLLTDRLPFPELERLDFIDYSCFETPIIPPSRLNISVDPALDRIVLRSLNLDPKKRYKNANQLLKALEKWEPKSKKDSKTIISSSVDITKTALGVHSPVDEESAKKLAKQALLISKNINNIDDLNEAADLMEEACNKWPKLKEKYEYLLKLWRKGIITTTSSD